MKFNFGRQKSKIGISMENKNKLNSLSIQRKSVDKSRMSFLSSMTDTGKEEETEQNKPLYIMVYHKNGWKLKATSVKLGHFKNINGTQGAPIISR